MSSRLLRFGLAASVVLGLACCSSSDDESSDGRGGTGGASATGGAMAGDAGDTAGAGGTGGAPVTSDPNDPGACTGPSQCVLVDAAQDCCVAYCGAQTIDFFTAIHRDHRGTWHAGQTCAGCLEPCSAEDQQAFTDSTSSFIAVCNAQGRCQPLDTLQSDITACSKDSDCALRWGLACCEDRGENLDLLTAVSNRTLLTSQVCPEEYLNCGPVPTKPADAHAVCGNDGRCAVAFDTASADAGSSGGTGAADAAPGGGADGG